MKAVEVVRGQMMPLPRDNVDTDQIIPKQFLKSIKRTGYGPSAFFDWRYTDDGGLNVDFELHQPRFEGRSILVVRNNFGCGSSREHAPWAIKDFGIRCVIAPSFADIFYNNCFKNGILPVVLPQDAVDHLMDDNPTQPGSESISTLQLSDLVERLDEAADTELAAGDAYPPRS